MSYSVQFKECVCVWSLFGWHAAVESNESQCVWPQCIAGWVRDWGKVEVTWLTVWKRLTGQQERGQALAAECIWMPAETLSNGKDLARCQGTGVTLCLSGSVCVYVWMYVFEWVGGRQWYITQQKASSLLHLFGAQIRPRAHTHTHIHTHPSTNLPFTISHLLCWHIIKFPPHSPRQQCPVLSMKSWSGLESTLDAVWEWLGWNVSDFEVSNREPCSRMTE